MGKIRQKRKNRSSIPRAKLSNQRTRTGKKKINILGNDIIASKWDRSLTLSQNYQRLGLSSRLKGPTGGTEKNPKSQNVAVATTKDPLAIPSQGKSTKLTPTEARVERDPDTGRILRVIRPEGEDDPTQKRRRLNPLSDPLNDISDGEDEDEDEAVEVSFSQRPDTAVVEALEAQAAEEEAQLSRKKRPRQQSKREQEWVERLVERHGDDIRAMARDRKLNPMQQNEGDIGRRVRLWKERRAGDDEG